MGIDYIKGIVSIFLDINGLIYKFVVTIIGLDLFTIPNFSPKDSKGIPTTILSFLSLSFIYQQLPANLKAYKVLDKHTCGRKSYSHREVFTPEDYSQLSLLYLPPQRPCRVKKEILW